MAQPKGSRKATLAKEYFDDTTALIDLVDKLGSDLTTSLKLEDAYIDPLLQMKQQAWLARNNGGEASSMISNKLAGQPLPADALSRYWSFIGKAEAAFRSIEDATPGLTLPANWEIGLILFILGTAQAVVCRGVGRVTSCSAGDPRALDRRRPRG